MPRTAFCGLCGGLLAQVGGTPGNPLHLAHPDYGNCKLEGAQFALPVVELNKFE